MNKTKLGGIFYPTVDQSGNEIPFDSLYIPAIYNEIWNEGVYLDILNQKKDMTIIDVGSNIGITVHHFLPYAKKIYAIEPSPEHFAALSKNKEFNNWDKVEVFNLALADKDGEMEFHQSPKNRTTNQLIQGQQVSQGWYNEEVLKVKTQSIDHFFEENKIKHVDFMKFDPEGAEDLILRSDGFKKIADKVDALEVEFHYPTWRELVDYLILMGYKARQYDSSAKIVLFFR
jgi:FkbM family methyltransferase